MHMLSRERVVAQTLLNLMVFCATGPRAIGGSTSSSIPLKARIAYGLQQLPGMSGTAEQVSKQLVQ